ncbi:peroxiredoxin [Chitinophaga polysaccharea]|uniref:Peroxiredoxin n=1 Tax=Chitinophaga polysaccharea TaxID=1293035 RepID=A0A561Q5S8_9BACT|nr:TlpA disulfide reductase family protein [Chitinophaga polysaccharea]TWF45720.1 peroxiredoxin [Chitinophaga polysaccharea]
MKRKLAITILVLIQHMVFAQPGKLELTPKFPKPQDELEIVYTTGFAHSTPETPVTAEILSVNMHEAPQLQNITMVQAGKKWTAKFKLSSTAVHFLVRIKLKDHVDDNGGKAWRFVFYNTARQPVKDAFLARAYICSMGGTKDFSVKKSVEDEDNYLKDELKYYPGNIDAFSYKWSRMMENGKTEMAKKELLDVYNANKENKELVKDLVPWFDRLQMENQIVQLKDSLMRATPKGEIAFRERMKKLMTSESPSFAIAEIPAILTDFPNMPAGAREMLIEGMVNVCLHQAFFEKAVEFIDKYDPESLTKYTLVAKAMIEKGEKLPIAVHLLEKEIDLINHATPAQVAYAGVDRDLTLGNAQYIYALGLHKQGKNTQALQAFDSSYQILHGQNVSANEDYLQLLFEEKKYEHVVILSEACLLTSNEHPKITELYKSASQKLNVPQREIDLQLDAIRKKAQDAMVKTLANKMLNETAPEFHLKYPDGNSAKLSNLKGKIIVLDFWATWCQPCIASLPKLQEMHDKYKSNPEVVILAVDKSETGNTQMEREQKMKDFIAKNKYAFNALYDDNAVADKYKVDGIPATIFIDRNGVIRFREHGLEDREFSKRVDFLLQQK